MCKSALNCPCNVRYSVTDDVILPCLISFALMIYRKEILPTSEQHKIMDTRYSSSFRTNVQLPLSAVSCANGQILWMSLSPSFLQTTEAVIHFSNDTQTSRRKYRWRTLLDESFRLSEVFSSLDTRYFSNGRRALEVLTPREEFFN